MPTVSNLKDTSDEKCKCGAWINHWETFSRKKASYCSVSGCYRHMNLVGAHVKKNGPDMKPYIIPLCQEHNLQSNQLIVRDDTIFVSAITYETCERT